MKYAKRVYHDLADTVEYKAWENMKQRCRGETSYIEKGITVCKEWDESFLAFLLDVGERPSSNHSIDRIKNSEGYHPGNVRWATQKEQMNNLDKNVMITKDGVTRTMSEWADHLGVNYCTLNTRHHKGLTDEEILAPVKTRKRKSI